jgi:ATP/maltotriose-dependent transcriptional regulator MalT
MTELVEREREIAALAALLDAARAGEGRVAWIEGPAGIGKSTLLAEARRHAAGTGARVLAARGSELERAEILRREAPVRQAQDRRGPPQQRLPQARDPLPPRAAGALGGG